MLVPYELQLLQAKMKQICIDKATIWLNDLSEKRDEWSGRIDEFLSNDAF